MMSIIDTHAHLDLHAFDDDRSAVIDAALQAGVHAIVLIGYDPLRWDSTRDLCESHPCFVRSVGIHPNSANIWSSETAQLLSEEAARGDAVAIGEIGLDFFREHADPEVQRVAFREQLRLAIDMDLPIIIHQRDAEAEVLAAVAEFAPLRGVLHCFSGDAAFASECIDLGLHLGVGGVVTYPRSAEVRDALRAVPLESIVLETDAPYLAPQARRGKRNEPALIRSTLEVVAAVREQNPEDIARITSENAEALFGSALARSRSEGMERARCLL